jgi:hypothetical protein
VGSKGLEVLKDKKTRTTIARLSIWRRMANATRKYLIKSSQVVKAITDKTTALAGPVIKKAGPALPYIGVALQIYGAYSGARDICNYMSPQEKLKDPKRQSNNQQGSDNSPEPEKPEDKNDQLSKLTGAKVAKDIKDKITENKALLSKNNEKHIFRDKTGHLLDTPENRAKLIDVASDKKNFLGLDQYGNEWYAKTASDGKQVWASVRDKVIRNGGVNENPKFFNSRTGLCNEPPIK